MSYDNHKIYGQNYINGLMGFQFNYPCDGAVFDITRQRYIMLNKGQSDESLKAQFIAEAQYSSRSLEDRWRSINDITNTKEKSK